MANRERGELRLVTPERTYTLRLTVGHCCELEDQTQQDFDTLTARVNRGRVVELRWLLWAALQPYHAPRFPSVESVSSVLDSTGRFAIRASLQEFLQLNQDDSPPRPDERAKGESEPESGSLWRRLYVDARAHGIPTETFWAFSLRELWREMAAIRQYDQAERDARITQAWWIAALVWQRKLPELDQLLKPSDPKPNRPQTWQEMRAAFRAAVKARDAAETRKRAS